MMKSLRSRLAVVYMGLMALMVATVWCANRWYLEEYYTSQKVKSLNQAYQAIDRQIIENMEKGISIEEGMLWEQDVDGNITEGSLKRLVQNFSETSNVSMLMIDNDAEKTAVYSTARDPRFLEDRVYLRQNQDEIPDPGGI